MKKTIWNSTLLMVFLLLLGPAGTQAQDNDKEKKNNGKIKPYEEIITAQAVSDEGLFNVHKVSGKYYFEIPFELLEREILVVSRISGHVKGLNFGGAGMKSRPQQVVRWQRHDDKVLLRSVSFNNVAEEGQPIYQSVRNNNFEPIVTTFDIAAFNPDSTALVFDVTSFFTTDIPMIGALSDQQRTNFKIKGLEKDRSLINYMKSFPENVEVRHVLTYRGDALPDNQLTNTLSIEMNQSFIELPAEPMQPRMYDARVGYFSVQQTDYGLDEQKAAQRRYIARWRLEPKDWDAYRRGELVEPVKPIVYYVDPATPEKWRPYIKQGVEDWQEAFEAAGFKNAILAKDPPGPEEDPDWSPEDVRYSVIRYITTDIQNAQGPHVHDPRTGEILESDILWYHNVMNLLRNWYFIQTAAVNLDARGIKFKEEVMGKLIRFVAAHEVGHTLGLPHNMGASPAYSIDSLRSPGFVQRMGVAPSIMDYARFNYVAQPEDEGAGLHPRIGPYDKWAIVFGYKRIPGVANPTEERAILNEWIKERAGNPYFRYGGQQRGVTDPSAQTEDVGQDAVEASRLGIANLQRIMPKLLDWTYEEAKGYEELEELYGQLIRQLQRYMGHVSNNVGGVYQFVKTADEEGLVFQPVLRAHQAKCVKFINEQLFQTPQWLINKDILQRIEAEGMMDRLRSAQVSVLNNLFNGDRLLRLQENHILHGEAVYSLQALFDDTRQGVFSELAGGRKIDPFRRNLQRAYLEKMNELMELKEDKYDQSDIKAIARSTLKQLKTDANGALKITGDAVSRMHLEDLVARIDATFEGKRPKEETASR